ncbi:MAG: hypothetical protein ACSLFK_03805 [Gemmatimonadaceae bacterium]
MTQPDGKDADGGERVPLGQRVFDNMYLLLVLGVAVMLIIFTGWGLWEIVSMPQGTLP